MIDRLGRDCHPLQYLRELTHNAIDAIAETGGEVVWDVAWGHYDLTDQYKLAIIDNGVGMTGPEMLKYINQLSSSIHVQSHSGNYGVGAKIAAATRNHAGMLYFSWKDGKGHMLQLWRDPDTNEYGARRLPGPDGHYREYIAIADDYKPAQIKDHGTMVVLLGNDDDENTVEPSPEIAIAGRRRWITKYLNTRYFCFPEGVSVKVREGYQAPRDDSRRNFLRNISGMKQFLDENSEWSGEVELTDATAHVWIFDESETRTKLGDMYATAGHVAALHQNELYELKSSRAGVALLQQFGVIFGHQRVVIYVEPRPAVPGRLETNTARTQLILDGEPLPWAEWAAEFRDSMPTEIKELMERISAGSTSHDHQLAIRERLKAIADLLRVSRYRPSPQGTIQISDSEVGGAPTPSSETRSKKGGSSGGGRGGRGGDLYALLATQDNGTPGEEVARPDPLPITKWVSVVDGTRTIGDPLEDRAAKFYPEQNLLLINGDFRVFTDMINRWNSQYGDTPGAREIVVDAVREWFEQALVETVVGAQSLIGSAHWPSDDLGKIWGEEGLTAAVLQRYHVDISVKRSLGAKLGSLKG